MALLVPDTFDGWLRARGIRRILPSYGAAISGVSAIIAAIPEWLAWKWLTLALIGIQLGTILILFLLIPNPLEDPHQSPRATLGVRQFVGVWRRVWAFWLVLFLALAALELLRSVPSPFSVVGPSWAKSIASVVLNALSNLSTAAILMCYVIASRQTVIETEEGPKATELHWDRVVVFVILFGAFDLLCHADALQGWQFLPWPDATKIPVWIAGLLSGLAIALLVGRLDSKLLNLSIWVMAPLYGYAVIQPGWPAFDESPALRTILLSLALALKCLLWLVIYWMFTSGVFLYYLERINEIHDKVTADRTQFLSRVQRSIGTVSSRVEAQRSP